MDITTIVNTSTVLSFLGGAVAAATLLYKYVVSHITVNEAQTIYTKLKHVVDEYEVAKSDGEITTEEQLRIAEDSLAAIQEIVKDLQN